MAKTCLGVCSDGSIPGVSVSSLHGVFTPLPGAHLGGLWLSLALGPMGILGGYKSFTPSDADRHLRQ